MNGKREYGDYQTPIDFAEKICNYLVNIRNVSPSVIIEPTCGIGNFLKSSLIFKAKEYYGIEINKEYCKVCETIPDNRIKIINANLFSVSLKSLVNKSEQALILGNPPWVTNGTLSILESGNLPKKENFKQLKGIDALTGASNFDICEYIILQLINEFRDSNTVIAMLCKTSVARNVFKELKRINISFSVCDILEFNATKVFGISASACLLFIKLEKYTITQDICNVYDFENPNALKHQIGYFNGEFYSRHVR